MKESVGERSLRTDDLSGHLTQQVRTMLAPPACSVTRARRAAADARKSLGSVITRGYSQRKLFAGKALIRGERSGDSFEAVPGDGLLLAPWDPVYGAAERVLEFNLEGDQFVRPGSFPPSARWLAIES